MFKALLAVFNVSVKLYRYTSIYPKIYPKKYYWGICYEIECISIENIISDIRSVHLQSIADRFFIDDNTVKVSGIILSKPYKLQITAVVIIGKKKKKRVRSTEYTSTLNIALNNAMTKRTTRMQELKSEINSSLNNSINIAVSRAKKRLIIVGHYGFFGGGA